MEKQLIIILFGKTEIGKEFVVIISILQKYKGILMYLIFGVLTTIINLVSYYICYDILEMANVLSTCLAWLLAVIFAFITNKQFVFESQSYEGKVVLSELRDFFLCRVATGLLDVVIMFVAVDMLCWNAMIWKVISNVLVIVLNYIASKLIIFKK